MKTTHWTNLGLFLFILLIFCNINRLKIYNFFNHGPTGEWFDNFELSQDSAHAGMLLNSDGTGHYLLRITPVISLVNNKGHIISPPPKIPEKYNRSNTSILWAVVNKKIVLTAPDKTQIGTAVLSRDGQSIVLMTVKPSMTFIMYRYRGHYFDGDL